VAGLDIQTALDWRGRTVVDRAGEKIGTLKEIYLDESDRPSWGAVHTALFGLRETFVPLAEARAEGDQLQVPYDRDHVKDAPNVDPDVQLSADEEQRLFRHYGIGDEPSDTAGDAEAAPAAVAAEADEERASGSPEDRSAQPAESAPDDAMTRSEEEVRVGKRTRVRGRARLKKYVVTDYVETKVPVKREEVRLEHEPAEDDESR
jgi:hypothetical protein